MHPDEAKMLKRSTGVAVRITIAARDKKISIADLARFAGLSKGYLYRVTRGEQEPSWQVMCQIADALNVSLDSLRPNPPIRICKHCRGML